MCLGGWWGRRDFGHKSLPCFKKDLHPNSGTGTDNHSSAAKAILWKGEQAGWLSVSAKRVHSQICQGAVPSRGIWKAFSRVSPKGSWLPRAGWQSCTGLPLKEPSSDTWSWAKTTPGSPSVRCSCSNTAPRHKGDLCELYQMPLKCAALTVWMCFLYGFNLHPSVLYKGTSLPKYQATADRDTCY